MVERVLDVAIQEILRLVIDHPVWGAVAFFLMILVRFGRFLGRSRLGRMVVWVCAFDVWLRYAKSKGVPPDDAELRRLLLDGWNDQDPKSEPPDKV